MFGLSNYLIGFYFEGYYYNWNEKLKCYYNEITQNKFNYQPVGSYNAIFSSKDPNAYTE